MAGLKEDSEQVKNEFEGLSNATQIFIWSLVGLGVIVGVLIGGIVGVGIAVEEVEGRDCIEHDGVQYCADEAPSAA